MIDADVIRALQDAFWLAGEELMFHHTNPWELDTALTDWGYAVGPCEAQDHIGLEHVLARHPDRPIPILPRMVAEGRMGKIGGVGYYRYPGGGGAVIDPLLEDLIREEAWFATTARSEESDAVLVARMHTALTGAVTRLALAPHPDLGGCLAHAIHFPAEKLPALMPDRGMAR